jgi:hypothetical protein
MDTKAVQVSQKDLDTWSAPFFQMSSWKEIGEAFCPVDTKWQAIRGYPVFLRARLVSFPKTTAPFGIGGIHDFS